MNIIPRQKRGKNVFNVKDALHTRSINNKSRNYINTQYDTKSSSDVAVALIKILAASIFGLPFYAAAAAVSK